MRCRKLTSLTTRAPPSPPVAWRTSTSSGPAPARSRVTDIYARGRRGPVQAKFTTKELSELGELVNADIVVKPEEIALDAVSEAALAGQRVAQRNIEVLRAFAAKPLEGKPRRVHLRFCVSPVEIVGTERVEGLVIERNR